MVDRRGDSLLNFTERLKLATGVYNRHCLLTNFCLSRRRGSHCPGGRLQDPSTTSALGPTGACANSWMI